ncbi:MAG: FxsA family protein [Stellaceae bacterium]
MKPSWRFVFLAYVLLEVAVTLQVAAWLGAGWTLIVIILSGVAGIGVLRRERLAIFSQLRTGVVITEPLLSGLPDRVLRVIGGLLLIIPGLVSDFLALSLLVPGPRQWLVHRFSGRLGQPAADPTIIEGEFRRLDDATPPDQRR